MILPIAVILLSLVPSFGVTQKSDLRPPAILELPWGEKITVKFSNEVFGREEATGPPLTRAGDFSTLNKTIEFSLPNFEVLLELDSIRDAASALTRETLSLESRLATISSWYVRQAYESRECTKDEILASVVLSLQLEGMGAPKDANLSQKLLSLQPFFEKLWDKSACEQLAAPFTYVIAANNFQYIVGNRYGSWFASAHVNRTSRQHCGGKKYLSGSTDASLMECVIRTMSAPTGRIEPQDIIYPAIGISMAIEQRASAGKLLGTFELIVQKFVEAGIYSPDLIRIPPNHVKDPTATTFLAGGEVVWTKPLHEFDPLLVMVVGVNKCRDVLTVEGIERLCLKQAGFQSDNADVTD